MNQLGDEINNAVMDISLESYSEDKILNTDYK